MKQVDAYRELDTAQSRRRYYLENGYIVRRRLVDKALCDKTLSCFQNEIKPCKGFIYRQASADPEKHKFDSAGNVLNSILNPLAVNGKCFPEFRRLSYELLTSEDIYSAAEELPGEKPTMVQSMYFEGNPATWAHQDTYYLDAERMGSMVAVWIALEDIHEAAGRFYIGVKSHRIDMAKNGGNFDISFNHDRYKQLVLK